MQKLARCLGASLRKQVDEYARIPQVDIPEGHWLELPRRGRGARSRSLSRRRFHP